jgi:hypothetical protein
MPQMTATVKPLVRLGGTIRLTAPRSDGSVVELELTQGSKRGHVVHAVTSRDGSLVSVSARSWPLSGAEPQLAADVREAIQIAENRFAESVER